MNKNYFKVEKHFKNLKEETLTWEAPQDKEQCYSWCSYHRKTRATIPAGKTQQKHDACYVFNCQFPRGPIKKKKTQDR